MNFLSLGDRFSGNKRLLFAKASLMTERIILNIHHSDDYTDYLFQTVCIKNKRIIPLMNVSDAELKYAEWPTTLILNCDGETCDNYWKSLSVWVSEEYHCANVQTGYYLRPDGTIDNTEAELIRQTLEKELLNILENGQNLRDAYHKYFSLLWRCRETIYSDPRLFYADIGLRNKCVGFIPLGAMLKAIEENPEYPMVPDEHRWHHCKADMILIDYEKQYDRDRDKRNYRQHLWCPDCGELFSRSIHTYTNYWKSIMQLIENTCRKYDKGQGRSRYTIFNVIDNLSITG